MNSNEIGSQSLGKFHDEENNLTNSAHLYNDNSSNQISSCHSEKCKPVAETTYGYPIVIVKDDKVEQAEEQSILLQYRSIDPQPSTSEEISKPEPGKNKRNAISYEKKFEIIMYKDANPTTSWIKIAKKFNINKSSAWSLARPEIRAKIFEAMKNPNLAKLWKFSSSTKWHKEQLKKNLPVPDSKLIEIKEEEDRKKQQKVLERQKKPRTCIRIGRTRLTLSEKLQFIKRWEEEKTKNPEVNVNAVGRMLGINGSTLESMVKISDKIKRAVLIPETADIISIPREKLLRKMFDDAGVDFPPLPEKEPEPEPEPEGPPEFWFTLSAGEISEVVETTLGHCQFDQVEHARFVMNFRELVESTSGIVVPKDLPKFITKPIEVDDSGLLCSYVSF